jgi:sugar phosphate isomerase/epimerase
VFVACSTRCFSQKPLEAALWQIADLEFNKMDLALVEAQTQLRPSDVAEDLDGTLQRLRRGPSLTPCALELDLGPVEPDPKTWRKRFEAMCRLAKQLTVAVLSLPAAPLGTSLDQEVRRLSQLCEIAGREGLVLTVPTHSTTLTADPNTAIALCKAVPGLGLTLDPSHYINTPHRVGNFDAVYPYVRHVWFRDTGKDVGAFQVRIGQGEIEYARVINLLERHGYDRALSIAIHDELDNPFEVEVEVRKLKLLLESLL